jgi:hypothetical protein
MDFTSKLNVPFIPGIQKPNKLQLEQILNSEACLGGDYTN